MPLSEIPLLKSIIQIFTGNFFQSCLYIQSDGCTIGEPVEVQTQPGKKQAVVSDQVAKGVQNGSSFRITQPAGKKTVAVEAVSYPYRARGLLKYRIVVAVHFSSGLGRIQIFQHQVLAVSGESFIHPDIRPGSAGNEITKPLVCQFVGG